MIAFMVAGTASGVGKTTVALALMAAFRERGMTVQPFKCGPDFLDTGHHSAICGRQSRNLDTWMMSDETNRELFANACQGADVAIVEGVMGLFDGVAGGGEKGSSAEIAKLLHLPVVLVLDAGRTARSIAAVVKGFETFDPVLRFAGIVLNGVSTETHFRMLSEAIQLVTATPILGRIPKDTSVAIPERHLGLRTVEEETAHEERRTNFAAIAREHLDLAPLLKEECAIEPSIVHSATIKARSKVRFGVARDKAFSFYYADNLDLMREHGAEIVEFSPLHDEDLPPDLDGLYLGGGYPELYAEALSANKRMRVAIRSFVEQDRPVYAECGGMIYLGNSLTLIDGRQHPMAGVLPFAFEMTSRLVRFGYVEIEFTSDCLLGRKGQKARGHSFHYSRMLEIDSLPTAYLAHSSLSKQIAPEGFCYKNVLASYIHLHFRAKDTMASSLLDAAIRSRAVGVTA